MFSFFKLFIFICGFYEKVTCAFFFIGSKGKLIWIKNSKYDFNPIKVLPRCVCKLGIIIFARSVTWNYAYSPFNMLFWANPIYWSNRVHVYVVLKLGDHWRRKMKSCVCIKYDISFMQNYQELGMSRLIWNTLREMLRSDAINDILTTH